MSRARRGGGQGGAGAPWLLLRTELAEYQEGVHWVEPPALDAKLDELPASLAEFYRRFGGLRLFLDTVEIVPRHELARDADWWRVGVTLGAQIFVAGDGSVRLEDEEGETLRAAAALVPWLLLVVRREQLVFGKDGEFRDVFDDEADGELKVATRKKRAALGRQLCPEGALYIFEEALLALDDGDEPGAIELAIEASLLDPLGAAPHELLATLAEPRDPAAASAHWAHAGRVARSPRRAADALAWAAVLAPDQAAALAALARQRDPACVTRWLDEADRQLAEREGEVAQRLAKLALAVALDEAEKKRATQLALRGSLRVV